MHHESRPSRARKSAVPKKKKTLNRRHSCYYSWRNSDGGRCNWIEGTCVPNCADPRNRRKDLCESNFCVWSDEYSTCTFAHEKLKAREEFCKYQTKLNDNQRRFCTELTRSHSTHLYATEQPIELSKFMGCWYVHANIPTILDKGSVNNIEHCSWDEKGRIKFEFQYEKPAGEKKVLYQHGYVKDGNAWMYLHLNLPYIILYVSEDYSKAIVGYPDRSYLWIMTRFRTVDTIELDSLVQKAVDDFGYDRHLILKVPFDESAESPSCKP